MLEPSLSLDSREKGRTPISHNGVRSTVFQILTRVAMVLGGFSVSSFSLISQEIMQMQEYLLKGYTHSLHEGGDLLIAPGVTPEEIAYANRVVSHSKSHYPPAMSHQFLSVIIYEKILKNEKGETLAGRAYPKRQVIALDITQKERSLEAAFHHEFGHILLDQTQYKSVLNISMHWPNLYQQSLSDKDVSSMRIAQGSGNRKYNYAASALGEDQAVLMENFFSPKGWEEIAKKTKSSIVFEQKYTLLYQLYAEISEGQMNADLWSIVQHAHPNKEADYKRFYQDFPSDKSSPEPYWTLNHSRVVSLSFSRYNKPSCLHNTGMTMCIRQGSEGILLKSTLKVCHIPEDMVEYSKVLSIKPHLHVVLST